MISFTSIVGLLLAFFLFLIVVIWIVIHPERSHSSDTPQDYHLTYENITFRNAVDNTKLEGWWIPAQDEFFQEKHANNTIIFAHGFGDSRTSMPIDSLQLAKRFAFEGYNVLMFDFRNSGDSNGKVTTIGYYETYDILAAIEFAKSKGTNQVGLLGWSMGAAASLLAAEESTAVKAVVADSPFSDFNAYISEQFSYWTNLPNKMSPFIVKTAETILGLDYDKVSPVKAAEGMKHTDTAVLLIHGKKDNAISYKNSVEIKNKIPQAELWLIQDAGHIRGYKKEKEAYEEKLLEFFHQHLQKENHMYWNL